MSSFLNFFLLITLTFISSLQCTEVHHRVITSSDPSSELIWKKQETMPFSEMIVSWSGQRPQRGLIKISISIRDNADWSPWFDYAEWKSLEQHLFNFQPYKDIDQFLTGGKKATGFRVRVEAQNSASTSLLRALHVSITDPSIHQISPKIPTKNSRILDVPPVSQIALDHPDSTRICSPTSTAAAVAFLLNIPQVDPLAFAKKVQEHYSHIYGAWALNTAEASHQLGDSWYCYVMRCSHLDQIIDQLNKGYPVVVSIQGPITGGARPYESGHLIVIRGYDAQQKKLLCMDPGFPDNDATYVSYDVDDFLNAWKRRKGMAYMMTKTLPHRAS